MVFIFHHLSLVSYHVWSRVWYPWRWPGCFWRGGGGFRGHAGQNQRVFCGQKRTAQSGHSHKSHPHSRRPLRGPGGVKIALSIALARPKKAFRMRNQSGSRWSFRWWRRFDRARAKGLTIKINTVGGGYKTGNMCGYKTGIIYGYKINHSKIPRTLQKVIFADLTFIRPITRKFDFLRI